MALQGVRVIELAGLAPAPYCGMILSDFGAEVIRVDRKADHITGDTLCRGKRSIAVNIRHARGKEIVLKLVENADVLIEPFRPGVLERLGLGPQELLKRNPRLIVARLTGFGQTGMYSSRAGHDINYIAIAGALGAIGRHGEKPMFPVNVLGDFAAGGLLCAFGIVTALHERSKSGKGQVIDSAMVDGTNYLSSFLHGGADMLFPNARGANMLDSGAHFYEVYETKDNKYMAVGAIEPQFYAKLMSGLGFDPNDSSLPHQMDSSKWPEMKVKLAEKFKQKTRDEWSAVFDSQDACVTPILDLKEAASHPHNAARGLMQPEADGTSMPLPAPLLSRTPGKFSQVNGGKRPIPGQDTLAVLKEAGYNADEIKALCTDGAASVSTTAARL